MRGGGPLARIADRYDEIHLIVSPPRCCSTALARVFWEQPSVRYYSHEPFEVTYYSGAGLGQVVDKLAQPLDLYDVYKPRGGGRSLVIKEMPYQVGARAPQLLGLATTPVVFLMRDPRLNIYSRVKKKREAGESGSFPLRECGWELLRDQVAACEERGLPFVIVDATDFRNHPEVVLTRVFEALGLPFSKRMLAWKPGTHIALDNLGGRHRHLYARVLRSTRLQPATEAIPPLEVFPRANGLRRHVRRCLEIYRTLSDAPARVSPPAA